MSRELFSYPPTDAQLRDELAFIVQHLRELGFESCEVLFGFAWGHEYYPGSHWEAETILLDSLLSKVEEVEGRGLGSVGEDDLWLKVPDFEFLFDHHACIYLMFEEDAVLVNFFFARWESLGFPHAEWRKGEDGLRVKVRGDFDAKAN